MVSKPKFAPIRNYLHTGSREEFGTGGVIIVAFVLEFRWPAGQTLRQEPRVAPRLGDPVLIDISSILLPISFILGRFN